MEGQSLFNPQALGLPSCPAPRKKKKKLVLMSAAAAEALSGLERQYGVVEAGFRSFDVACISDDLERAFGIARKTEPLKDLTGGVIRVIDGLPHWLIEWRAE